jgi:hypothetical protein
MSRFVYYNNNPYGIEEEDCVTRAITLASGLCYFDISNKLKLTAELLGCEELCVCCYDFLIENVLMFRKVEIDRDMTVGDFAQQHPRGIYLLRMEQHITTLIDGKLYDLWDSSDKEITHAWFCGY